MLSLRHLNGVRTFSKDTPTNRGIPRSRDSLNLRCNTQWQQPPSLSRRLRSFVKKGTTATGAPQPAYSALIVVRFSARIAALCCISPRVKSTTGDLRWQTRHVDSFARASTRCPPTVSPARRPCVSRVTGRCTLQVARVTIASPFNGHAVELTAVVPLTERMPRTTYFLLL